MKVILLKDVPKIGKKFDVKEVADGFATNMLIPRGMAEIATNTTIKKILAQKEVQDAERKIQEDLLAKILNDLDGKLISVEETANEQGHLFAGLHKEEISKIISEKTGQNIPLDYIQLEKPIKELGEHKVEISSNNLKAVLNISISAKK